MIDLVFFGWAGSFCCKKYLCLLPQVFSSSRRVNKPSLFYLKKRKARAAGINHWGKRTDTDLTSAVIKALHEVTEQSASAALHSYNSRHTAIKAAYCETNSWDWKVRSKMTARRLPAGTWLLTSDCRPTQAIIVRPNIFEPRLIFLIATTAHFLDSVFLYELTRRQMFCKLVCIKKWRRQ